MSPYSALPSNLSVAAAPASYVARKLTRHYYFEVANFLKGFNKQQIEGFRDEVCEALTPFQQEGHPGKPDWSGGDFFFAAIVPDGIAIGPDNIALGAFLDFEGRTGRVAKLLHIAINEELLSENPRLLNGFFQLIHRSASSYSKTQIIVTTALDTCLPRYLARAGYQIIRSEYRGDSNQLSVTFRMDILPAYTGDAQRWTPLCRWYLGLAFSQYLTPWGPEQSMAEQSTHSIAIDIKPHQHPDRPQAQPANIEEVLKHLHTVPVNAVVVPTTDLLQPEKLADELDANLRPDRYNLAFLNCRSDVAPTLRRPKHQCRVFYRDEIEELLKQVKGLYFSKPLQAPEKNRLSQLLRLKLGFERRDRHGVLVEIDRESYSAMLRKLKAEPNLEKLLFFNDGGFGETLDVGTAVHFYVWDSPSVASEVPGVVAAYGRVAQVKSWTFKQLDASWDDLSPFTIWKEPFAEQYFSEPVVGFYLQEMECVDEDSYDKQANSSLDGVPYGALLAHLFGSAANTAEQLKACEQLLPTWDVKNLYLEEFTSDQLRDDMRKNARGKRKHFLRQRMTHTPPTETLTASPGVLDATEAAYWVNRPAPKLPDAGPAPDVFFSFAGADEVGVGWKTYIMNAYTGELQAAGFQAPYVFDETKKRESLGKLWAEALVERMSCCKTALILWSPSYLSSPTCFKLELPYLVWRWKRQNLPLYFLRLTDTTMSRFRWAGVDIGDEPFDINAVNDDRYAIEKLTEWPANLRNATLQYLRDDHQLDLLSKRLSGTIGKVLSDLKRIGAPGPYNTKR